MPLVKLLAIVIAGAIALFAGASDSSIVGRTLPAGPLGPTLALPPRGPAPATVQLGLRSPSVRSAREVLERDPLVTRAIAGQTLRIVQADRWYGSTDPSYGVRLTVTVPRGASGRFWLPFVFGFDSRSERAVSLPAIDGEPSQHAHVYLQGVTRYWALVDLKHGDVASFLPAYMKGRRPYQLVDPAHRDANFTLFGKPLDRCDACGP
jgi:hypothetical protein